MEFEKVKVKKKLKHGMKSHRTNTYNLQIRLTVTILYLAKNVCLFKNKFCLRLELEYLAEDYVFK